MELSGNRIFTVGALAVVVVLGLGGLVAWGAGAFDGPSTSPNASIPASGAELVLDGNGDSCGGCPFTGEKSGGMAAAMTDAGPAGCTGKTAKSAADACSTGGGCGGCEEMTADKPSCEDGGDCCGGESCAEDDGRVTEQIDN